MRRFVIVSTLVILLLFGGLLGGLATSEVQQTGTAAGVRYTFANTGLQGYRFETLSTGFRFEQRSWFGWGSPRLEVAVEKGRLFVNRADRGPIKAGEQLTVTSDNRVLVNGKEVRP